jgi:nitrate/nitrite transporter NarK
MIGFTCAPARNAASRSVAIARPTSTQANTHMPRSIRSLLLRNRASAGCIAIPTTRFANIDFANIWALVQEPCDENVIRSAPQTTPCARSREPWILAATILATSMAFIDGNAVNVALPALQTNLNATAVDVQWVIEAYSLLLSALLLVGGSLGDHYGRRRVFLIGVVLFAVASAACGLAVNIHQLIAARARAPALPLRDRTLQARKALRL